MIFRNKERLIPFGFVECEYLESTGTQYIDTNYNATTTASNLIKIIANAQYTEFSSSSTTSYICGCYNNAQRVGIFERPTTNNWEFSLGNVVLSTVEKDLNRHTFTLDGANNYWSVDGVSGTLSKSSASGEGQSISIFAYKGNTDMYENIGKVKLYSLKIYDNGTLVRNFIPCLDSTGTPCLYDTVSKTAFYNQGTGDFLYKVKVPRAYQEVEYIESSRTQWIDTGIKPNYSNRWLKIVVDGKANNTGTSQFLWTCSNGYTAGSYLGYGYSNNYNNFVVFYYGAVGIQSSVARDTNRHRFSLNINENTINLDIDGNASSTSYNIIWYSSYTWYNNNIILFGLTTNGSYFEGRIYSCQIYDDNNSFVRYFVPVYKKSTGEIGLYDLVNDKFYTNAGTGTFAKGANVASESDYPIVAFVANTTRLPRLPSAYQELEYIESTGTQYIDSGLTSSNDNWEFILQFQRNSTTTNNFLFGNTNGFNASLADNYVYRATGQAITGITASNTSFDTVIVESLTLEDTIKISVNGTLTTGVYSNWNYGNELGIIGNSQYHQSGKYKRFAIIKNGEVVRDFVPCFRRTDGVAGLYDMANDVFYTNSGTGEFIKGPLVRILPGEYQEVEYIESSGTQYVDTGVIPSASSKAICDVQFTNTNNQLCGVYGSATGKFQFGMLTNQGFYAGLGTLSYYFNKTKDTNEHTFVLDGVNKIVSVDTESYYDDTISFSSNADKFLLFGRTSNHIFDTEYACSMKLYSCKIYDNGTPVRDFVPCYRKSDGTIGLYDYVTGQFFTNQGTGVFTKGNNVYNNIIKFKAN